MVRADGATASHIAVLRATLWAKAKYRRLSRLPCGRFMLTRPNRVFRRTDRKVHVHKAAIRA